ncbi:hypothetical protein [Azospirillum argentinense]
MPDPSSAADGGLLNNALSYLGTGALGAAVLWRALVYFGRHDRAAKMEAELRDDLRLRLDKAMTDIASMAHERNQAVMVKLQLETELRLSNEHLASARSERDEARTALVRVQHDVENLMATNQRLVEEAAVAEAEARGTPAGTKPGSRQVPGERPWKS